MAIITLGFATPIFGTIPTLFDIYIAPQRDIAPLTHANIIIAWDLLRYRIFDIAPVARDRLFEAGASTFHTISPLSRNSSASCANSISTLRIVSAIGRMPWQRLMTQLMKTGQRRSI